LQTVTLLSQILKSGKIKISTNNQKLINLTIKDKVIDLNIIEKKILKKFKDSTKNKSFLKLVKNFKVLAAELDNQEVTITLSYQGETVLTIGSDAKANFSNLISRTKRIEINDLRKLIQILA
jgi:membrane-bound lytic murein transglycosylase MltF